MTDLRTFFVILVICGTVSIVMRLLPLKLDRVRMPRVLDAIITQMGKYVSSILLICVLCGFLMRYDTSIETTLPPRYLALVIVAYMIGMTKAKRHHVFIGVLAVYIGVVKFFG